MVKPAATAQFSDKLRGLVRLRRATRFVWQGGPGWVVASAALLVLQGVLPLGSLYLIKMVIDDITRGITHANRALMLPHVLTLVGMAGVVTLISAMLRSVSSLVSVAQSQQVTDRMQGMLYAKSVAVDLEYYENPSFYDTLHRAQEEAPYRPTRVVNSLMQIGQAAISLIAVAGLLLFSLSWAFVLILVTAAVPGLLVKFSFTNTLYQLRRRQTVAERGLMLLNMMLTGELFAKEIRLFRLGEFFIGRAQETRRDLRQQKLHIATRRTVADMVTQACATTAVFGLLGFLAYRTFEGMITVGTMVMYYQLLQRGQAALQDLLGALADMYENNLFLTNLYEFLDLAPRVASPSSPQPVPTPLQGGVVFEHVSFRYGTGKPVLTDVSFALQPGETIALVGENGCGKTTLIKLLCRLYDPTGGRILVDGVDVRDLDMDAWRQDVSVVFQDYVHYPLTARENIWLGDVNLSPLDERIEIAARRAGAHDVVTPLKHGYDTLLGNAFNEGAELSIGQWQKVAIARAFVRDAQIVILDEPSSALDAEAEAEVFEHFHQLVRGKMALLISHRLSTVRMADRIIVLQGGRIAESGTHAHLLEVNGIYARMFALQANQYNSA